MSAATDEVLVRVERGVGFLTLNRPKAINSLEYTLSKLHTLTGGKGKTKTATTYVPCYVDTTDATTLRYVVLIPETVAPETIARLPPSSV